MPSLVLDPTLTYAELADHLRALEWEWYSEAQQMPTIPGEPERVTWVKEAPEAQLVYTFNPVVRLRVVDVSGDGAQGHCARIASFVPHLDQASIAQLLTSQHTETALLGLYATQELALSALSPLVLALADRRDELVSRVASQVAARLPPLDPGDVLRQLLGAHPASSDRASLFSRFAKAAIRRQVVRHAGRDIDDTQVVGLEFLLQMGLSDPDWEVRASSMLVAGRRTLRSLRAAVADVALPGAGSFGLSALDVDRLQRLRAVVHAHLGDEPRPADPHARHALACVLGEPSVAFDEIFLWVHALTTPAEPSPAPARMPAPLAASDQGCMLARSRIAMAWVGTAPCWLGTPDGGGEVTNPLRRVVPSAGYYIARRPVSRAVARWALAGARGPVGVAEADGNDDYVCSLAEARELVAALGAIEGAAIELPTADQWEIAARGQDGRRYPWGNGLEPDEARSFLPAAMERPVGSPPHWTRVTGAASPVMCGGPELRCDRRSSLNDNLGLVRPLLAVP